MLARYTTISVLLVIVVAVFDLSGCGSPRTKSGRHAALDEAVVYYIDGDLARAEALLVEITSKGCTDEDCVTAYLYLGRVYLARGDYEKAADAFSTGEALGGDLRFAEYFNEAQSHLTTSPARIIQLSYVKRGQLAALIGDMFGSRLRRPLEVEHHVSFADTLEGQVSRAEPKRFFGTGDIEQGIDIVTRAGVMRVLPDGDFHAEEGVTEPAFYVVVQRLARALGAPSDVLTGIFPRGYRGMVAQRAENGRLASGENVFASGGEVRRVLDALDKAVGSGNE